MSSRLSVSPANKVRNATASSAMIVSGLARTTWRARIEREPGPKPREISLPPASSDMVANAIATSIGLRK